MRFSTTVAAVCLSFVGPSNGLRRQKLDDTALVVTNKHNATARSNQSFTFDPCKVINDNEHISKKCSCNSSLGRFELECGAEILRQNFSIKFDMTMCDVPPRANAVVSHNGKDYSLYGEKLNEGIFVGIPAMSLMVLTEQVGIGLRLKQKGGDHLRTFSACLDACYDGQYFDKCAGRWTGALPWCFLNHKFDLEKFCGTEYCHTETGGTCKWLGCAKSRGETECISGKCYCKGDSCVSKDKQKCIKEP
eukprot:TRINITY_DN55718_c0_g1_i1.p1 TRINITY_DN55718_c0_g1~~TRINITY_DN55718_c0_g1_i1.p1  ORF type:complete len:248 (-),score=21.19 TRINITY_DN55718_c0_g1_i1:110-853(-)